MMSLTTRATSQTTYCGDQTLLVTRKAAVSRKMSCGSLGRLGAASASAATATHAARKSNADHRLIVAIDSPPSTGQCSASNRYQTDPQSAPRLALKM